MVTLPLVEQTCSIADFANTHLKRPHEASFAKTISYANDPAANACAT